MEIIKIHPPFVHFAIAFPVFLLVIDLYYRAVKKEMDGLHAFMTYLSVLAVVLGSISGIVAHEPIEDLLEYTTVFKYHNALGIFLALYFLTLGLFRFLRKSAFTILLLVGVFLLLLQGFMGGQIVYDYLLKATP